MKLLFIGDPHYKPSNVKDTELMESQVLFYIKKLKPDVVINLGDTLDTHERIHIGSLARSVQFMNEISKLTKHVVLIGNHDRKNNSEFLTDVHPFIACTIITSSNNTSNNIEFVSTGLVSENILYVPYVPNGRFREACDIILKSEFKLDSELIIDKYSDYVKLIVCHQEFKGVKMGGIISEDGDDYKVFDVPIVSGHIHETQVIENVLYPGTPMLHGFGSKNVCRLLYAELLNSNELLNSKYETNNSKWNSELKLNSIHQLIPIFESAKEKFYKKSETYPKSHKIECYSSNSINSYLIPVVYRNKMTLKFDINDLKSLATSSKEDELKILEHLGVYFNDYTEYKIVIHLQTSKSILKSSVSEKLSKYVKDVVFKKDEELNNIEKVDFKKFKSFKENILSKLNEDERKLFRKICNFTLSSVQ